MSDLEPADLDDFMRKVAKRRNLENMLSEWKTVLPNTCLRSGFAIEGYAALHRPSGDEGPFCDHGPLRWKSEARNPNGAPRRLARYSGFGVVSDFGVRNSDVSSTSPPSRILPLKANAQTRPS